MSRCKAKNKRGELCGAPAMQGSDYCFFHDPEVAGQRAAARAQGGRNRGWAAKRAKELRESTDPDDMLMVSWQYLIELLERVREEGDHRTELKIVNLLLRVALKIKARGGLRKPERERDEGLPDYIKEGIALALARIHTEDPDAGDQQ